MKTTVEALKELFVKMKGDAAQVENVNTIPDMIEALTSVAESGSGGSTITAQGETLMIK
jgi:hypothetical protein